MPTLKSLRAIGDVRTPQEFLKALVSVAERMDFGFVGGVLVIERPQRRYSSAVLGNFPDGYEDIFRDVPSSQRDPVLGTIMRSPTPIVWDQQTYVDADAADLWEAQAPFGYRTGLAVALHLPGARHFLLGLDRYQPLPSSDNQMTRLLGDVQLLAVHAQEAAVRLLTPLAQPVFSPPVALTPSEVEVLRWVMAGKDTAAIAQIIGISARTVKFHASNATEKLECETRHAAVLRAIEYGLLPSP